MTQKELNDRKRIRIRQERVTPVRSLRRYPFYIFLQKNRDTVFFLHDKDRTQTRPMALYFRSRGDVSASVLDDIWYHAYKDNDPAGSIPHDLPIWARKFIIDSEAFPFRTGAELMDILLAIPEDHPRDRRAKPR